MKIANIVCVFKPYRSGIGESAYNFAKYGNELGFESSIFSPRYFSKLKVIDNYEGVNVIRIKPWLKFGNGAFIPGLFFYLKRYDIIYLHYPFFGAGEVVWFFKIIFGKRKKMIIHYHMDISGLSFFAKILSLPSVFVRNKLFKMADLITCASLEYIKNSQIKKIYENNPDKFMEIPFGVDENFFYPSVDDNKISNKIIFIGGLDKAHYFKGVDVLLKAFKAINLSNKSLIIIGDGNLKNNYKNLAKNIGILDKVEFLSGLNNKQKAEILRTGSVLVLPSINNNEAFGIVLLEAMASGVPVIASDLPGVRSVFVDNLQGLLVKPNNAEDLKIKIEYILNNNSRRLEMGIAGRKMVKDKYTWPIFKKNLSSVLNRVTNIKTE
jgi:glycosyltransferase involved in cell wall biosynthesis